MLANLGAIPGLAGRQDAIVLDEQAHSSMQEAAKIARANGTKVATFAHSDPQSLEQTLEGLRPYRCALVCIDGVYSMSGMIPPMAELNEVARAGDAVLYIDDAHGTGVLGEQGRGTVLEALGSYDNTFVVGSLSKAFSCAGGFIGCPEPFHRLLKIRSSPYVFGGPVVPCFLEAIGTVIDILRSGEYDTLRAGSTPHISRLTRGLADLGLVVMGGATPIVSVLIGDEADTLDAGKFLFDRGYYVQSVLFPAVPYHAGVLRVQCNANHDDASIDGLIDAFAALSGRHDPPRPRRIVDRRPPRAAIASGSGDHCRRARAKRDVRRARSDPPHHVGGGGGAGRRRDRAFQGDETSRPHRGWVGGPGPGRRAQRLDRGRARPAAQPSRTLHAGPERRRPELRAAPHRGLLPVGRTAGAVLSARRCRDTALGRDARDHRGRGDRRAWATRRRTIDLERPPAGLKVAARRCWARLRGRSTRTIRAPRQFRLHQVEQVTDSLHRRQLFGREPDAELALDPHHQPDQIHRVEAQRFAQILIVLRQRNDSPISSSSRFKSVVRSVSLADIRCVSWILVLKCDSWLNS